MTTLSYEASGLNYTDWCKSVMNEHIKDKTLTRTVDKYTRAGRYGKPQFAQNVTKLPQYITLVGQHLVVKSVVLWQKKINGDYYESI